jgi:crotonobetainyl-CoA:carnitine CoA-transferase CaiB-like acyl-CoA transferase
LNYISIAGLLSLTGNTDKGYLIPPVQIADVIGAFQTTTAITAALLQRFRNQKGQYLDISLMNGVLFTLIGLAATHYAGLGVDRDSLPLAGQLACYNVYRTADDRFLALALLEPKFWQTFCLKMGLSEYFHNQLQTNQRELIDTLAKKFEEKSLNEWLDFFEHEDVCITPVRDFDDAMKDLHRESNNMILKVEYPSGNLQQMKTPFIRTSDHNMRAPVLGEHNVEILSELGFPPDEIASLKAEGVL